MWTPPASIYTPAYVADIALIQKNLETLARVKQATGAKILLATKAFALPVLFPLIKDILDGTTASGLFEAHLGAEEFGKEVHVYSPAYTPGEFAELAQIADHFYFNSTSQLARYQLSLRPTAHIGVRVNPEISQVKNNPIYDPCSPSSRFGMLASELDSLPWDAIDIFHVHALCENQHAESVNLINGVSEKFSRYIAQVEAVNFGGGHFMTHPDYDVSVLIDALNRFQDRHQVKVILEPGAAVVLNAGYLVTTITDIIERPGLRLALTDTSATCHMPDVLEVPYTPYIRGAKIVDESHPALGNSVMPTDSGSNANPNHATADFYVYTLGGKTCLTGDIIGTYAFPKPLQPGDRIVFEDMMQYSFVKNTTFNGTPLPDLAALHPDGRYEVIKHFDYEDFRSRLG